MPRIRQNIVTGEWVVVSPERSKRPDDYVKRPFQSQLIHQDDCVFCVGQPVWQSRIVDADTSHIYTIENKYPAFSPDITLEETGHNFYNDDASVGAHEVIVLKKPQDTLFAMSSRRLCDLLEFLQHRMRFYEHDHSLRSFTPIYNHGHEAGASVAHPHAQFFMSTLVAPRLQKEFFGSNQYFQKHATCVFCAMADFELEQNTRVVARNAGALSCTDYAPRFPFETWIMPLQHQSSFSQSRPETLMHVAEVLWQTLKKMHNVLNSPPLNWYIHSSRTVDSDQQASYHWHIEILPRLSTYGGFELSSDMIIGTVLPEMAAEYLRG